MVVEDRSGTDEQAALHGDVVGYSKLIADNEIETRNTLNVLRRIVEVETVDKGGTMASFVGDEFLAVFDEAAQAVDAALEIQRRIAVENTSLPAGRQMRFRLGIHIGHITHEDERWYGDGINIAARLQALAEPGGINASREALDRAGDISARIESLGPTRLKNIPEPVTIFRLVDDDQSVDSDAKPWRRRIPTSTTPSVAVSPFVNFGDDADGHFADGMMMALTISLARIPGVDVAGEMSMLQYRDQAFSSAQLGHELGVRYVLEGAVQRSGSQIRVMTQLIEVETGATPWSDRFEASFDDAFAAQDDLVLAIASALDVEVLGGDRARMYRADVRPEAVEVLYKGLQHLSNGSPSELQAAADSFEEVIRMEPDSASGYSMAALTHNWMAMFGATDDIEGHYALAEQRANEAIERNDASGIGQMVLGHVRVHQRDWEGALEAVRDATDMRPSCDLTYGIAASVMRYLGRWEDAIAYANRAARLSPLFASWYHNTRADAERIGGNFDVASEVAEGVVAQNEEDVEALLTLAAAQSALGHSRHASAAVDHLRQTRPGITTNAVTDRPYKDQENLDELVTELRAAGLSDD